MPLLKSKLQSRLVSGHYSQRKTVGILEYFVKGILKEAIRTINHEDTLFFCFKQKQARQLSDSECSKPFAYITKSFHAQLPCYSKYTYDCDEFGVKCNALGNSPHMV